MPSHRHIDTFGRRTVILDIATGISEQAIIVVIAEGTRSFDSFQGANSQYLIMAHTSGTPDKTANARVKSK